MMTRHACTAALAALAAAICPSAPARAQMPGAPANVIYMATSFLTGGLQEHPSA
jgi:hypothetical protein